MVKPAVDSTCTMRTPFGINVVTGAAVVTAAAVLAAAAFPAVPARLAVMALAVAGYSAVVADTRASLAVAALAYLLFNGFLANRYGELAWDGATSVWHLAIFVLAVGSSLVWRWVRYTRVRAAFAAELDELVDITISDDKESHGA